VPVTTAGGRSGVCGASVPIFGGVVLDVTALTGIVAIDDESLLLTVRAGTFGHDLEDELRARGYTLGHWPQSIALSTVGGWLACRGAGQYSTRYGKIEDMVVGIEVVLADGRVVRTGGTPHDRPGYHSAVRRIGGRFGDQATLRIHPAGGRATSGVRLETPSPASTRKRAYPAWRHLPCSVFTTGLNGALRTYRRSICVLLVLDEGDDAIIDAVMTIVDEECTEATVSTSASSSVGSVTATTSAPRAAHARAMSSTRWRSPPREFFAAHLRSHHCRFPGRPHTAAANAHQSHATPTARP
jgi:alkyldihydroxyacetonephosphate synthase